ncbi:DUF1553 domain-containing protein [Novipirellula sp. SH528]|uniref:DUF1553 domain-containing protein n=1 Tax=Novipirellula sp. SH528 TaxID=3454466 RepID=UPI003FA0E04E
MRFTIYSTVLRSAFLLFVFPLFVMGSTLCWAQQNDIEPKVDFDRDVAPIFASHCLECHAGDEAEGGLSLIDVKMAMSESDSGFAILPHDRSNSVLWQRVDADEMPPKHPLIAEDKHTLKQWIDEGAAWGTSPIDPYATSTSTRAGRDWWSLQPLRDQAVPAVLNDEWSRNAIDAFVLKRLQDANLNPASEADPRTLIRRVYFDLVGLPPTPEQVAAFVSDPSDAAYEKVVADLLESKHYGERWGRHWLDVVRFGESDGFERNATRKNAWHYRDWVIESLNADMPYDEFVRQQLIGDQITGGIEGAAATGFWVAGVHNTVVGGSPRMRELARQDEIEEVLGTLSQSFLGLTVHCARCHDHKFDPISQEEYYQMASSISGLGFGERVEQTPEDRDRLDKLTSKLSSLQHELTAVDQTARREIRTNRSGLDIPLTESPAAFARWEFDDDLSDSIGNLHGTPIGNAKVESGMLILDGQSFVQTPAIATTINEKTFEAWVQLDTLDQSGGAAISLQRPDGGIFDAIVFGEKDPKQWMAGSNGFARTESFAAIQEVDAETRPVHIAVVYQSDGTIVAYRDGVAYGTSIRKSPLQTYEANQAQILFGLRHKPAGGNRFLRAKLYRAAFYDRALSAEEIQRSSKTFADHVTEQQIVASLSPAERNHRTSLRKAISNTRAAIETHTAESQAEIYTLMPGPGATTHVLLRGDPANVGDEVAPSGLRAVSGLSGNFNLAVDAPEAERRRKLADWVTSDANPLLARVMVNRIWHYHFGVGIVDTPNDLGFNGGRPTHPELLEYLAWQFHADDYRMKSLHRAIVTSKTYRQASHGLTAAQHSEGRAIDANNRLLWRGATRRLEAEVIRDAMLTVSGKMDAAAGGPSFIDVSVTENNGTTYYEPLDTNNDAFWRRTVYRFNPRGGRSALLDTFDCPDSASTAPRRAVTTTPLQALSLLNNSFVLQMADAMAVRVRSEFQNDTRGQVTRAWQLAISRDPSVEERVLSEQLVRNHGLAALCRGLFNANEFVMN